MCGTTDSILEELWRDERGRRSLISLAETGTAAAAAASTAAPANTQGHTTRPFEEYVECLFNSLIYLFKVRDMHTHTRLCWSPCQARLGTELQTARCGYLHVRVQTCLTHHRTLWTVWWTSPRWRQPSQTSQGGQLGLRRSETHKRTSCGHRRTRAGVSCVSRCSRLHGSTHSHSTHRCGGNTHTHTHSHIDSAVIGGCTHSSCCCELSWHTTLGRDAARERTACTNTFACKGYGRTMAFCQQAFVSVCVCMHVPSQTGTAFCRSPLSGRVAYSLLHFIEVLSGQKAQEIKVWGPTHLGLLMHPPTGTSTRCPLHEGTSTDHSLS